MSNPSVMSHLFSMVPKAEIQRSSFDRSHGYKTTFDAGYLIPVFVDEVLPGDTFNLRMSAFARLSTPLKPIMDNMFLDSFFFFVPNRLVWANWPKFNGEKDNPGDAAPTTYSPPVVTFNPGPAVGSLADYMGLPTGVVSTVQALPFRAYNLIWNTWFRDQNLQDSAVFSNADVVSQPGDFVLRRRGKRHDYFTSCLPWPQKGDTVYVPMAGTAPVKGIGKVNRVFGNNGGAGYTVYETGQGASTSNFGYGQMIDPSVADKQVMLKGTGNPGNPDVYADLNYATATAINSLRTAFQIQKMAERDARGGTRYCEVIQSHFGVIDPSHAVLQRPVYLGGGSSPVNIHPVAQTAPTEAGTTSQGNLAAFGTVGVNGHGFVKSFTEHGFIIGLVSVRADLTYQQGLNRMWSRTTRVEYFWPALAHLGEQAVLNQEIYKDGSANDTLPFGYQERYAEYRYKPSLITGKFRSSDAGTLDVWHLSQEFGALPTLNSTFIQETPPVARCVAVPSEPHFLGDFYFDLKCARAMPLYGVPGYMDRF